MTKNETITAIATKWNTITENANADADARGVGLVYRRAMNMRLARAGAEELRRAGAFDRKAKAA